MFRLHEMTSLLSKYFLFYKAFRIDESIQKELVALQATIPSNNEGERGAL